MSISRALVLSGGGGRGAYQAGVWTWLEERQWKPELVCGSSVGAINGAAIAGGMSSDEIRDLWHSIEQRKVFRPRLWRNIVHRVMQPFGFASGMTPIADTTPLRNLLEQQLDLRAIHESDTELVVSAVRVMDARVRYFEGRHLAIGHIMASSAIPIVFPWEMIDGDAYWDGGLAVNTPLLPAIERGAREVVAVAFAPILEGLEQLPATRAEASRWLFEVSTLASAASMVALLRAVHGDPPLIDGLSSANLVTFGSTKLYVVAPRKLLGFRSLLEFDAKQTEQLFEAGYQDAEEQLGPLLPGTGSEAENQDSPADPRQ